jgi:hypothetical protein
MTPTITTDTRAAERLARFLRIYGVLTLVIFGSLSVGFAVHTHVLAKGGALNWTIWDDSVTGHVAPMLFAVYLTSGVFCLRAARHPEAYASFLRFMMWTNLAHGALMAVQAATMMDRYWSKWLTDIPFIWALAVAVLVWGPNPDRSSLHAS